jgi:glycerol-3-phosphate dehydrogenase subunit C
MRPDKPPIFDPNDPRYWDARDLEQELERVFSICHGCRMCVGYCPSFPAMFERVDNYVRLKRGEIDAFDAHDYKAVNDLCYQCKLCYFKCPYTPDDGHAFMLDFPRLMLRNKAQRARRDGVTLQDKALGEPQLLGWLGSGRTAQVANLVSETRLLRKVQEQVTGISADFNLPPFAPESFARWMKTRKAQPTTEMHTAVVMFATCTVTFNLPSAGKAAVQVLEHNGVRVHYPVEQTCCGMPNLDGGDVASAIEKAKRNVATLYPFVEKGMHVVVPGPTCSYVLKKEYPELLATPEAKLVAENTFDLMEYVRIKLLRDKKLRTDFKYPLGKIALHAACHLRAQKIGTPAQNILRKVPGTEVEIIEQCSAVDGTWGMKAQYYELGRRYAQKLVEGVKRVSGYSAVATDCPLSGQRLAQELGTVAVHPIELLNRAYGLLPVGPSPEALSTLSPLPISNDEVSP